MKARSLVIMIALLCATFTGYGQTTSDLDQNSTITTSDLTFEALTNVVETPVLQEVFTYVTETGQMEVHRYKLGECEYLKFGDLSESLTLSKEDIINPRRLVFGSDIPVRKHAATMRETYNNDSGGMLSIFYTNPNDSRL